MNLETLLSYHRPNHSNVQMDFFITGKTGLTDYGRFKQALREFEIRRQAYMNLMYQIIETEQTNAGTPYLRHKREETKNNLWRNAEGALRELARFYKQALFYFEASGVTHENIEELEMDLMYSQIAYQAGLDLLSNGHVTPITFSAIVALPKGRRLTLLSTLKEKPMELVECVAHWPDPHIPKIEQIDIQKIRELVAYSGPEKELLGSNARNCNPISLN